MFSCPFFLEVGVCYMSEEKIKNLLISNDLLFNQLYIFSCEFDILPNKKHNAIAIKYVDLQECREKFIEELSYIIQDWVYSRKKYKALVNKQLRKDENEYRAHAYIMKMIKEKFRRDKKNALILQGQFGELLLYATIQKFFGAIPILRKMPITTSTKHERYGADAIHYKYEGGKNLIYLGEAKTYESDYQFSNALKASLESIMDTYDRHRSEIERYSFDDFIDEDLIDIAQQYSDSTLENCEVHLVCIVIYNEKAKINQINEQEIKSSIEKIIKRRCASYKKDNFNDYKDKCIFNRVNYIFFPVWELDKLLKLFGEQI